LEHHYVNEIQATQMEIEEDINRQGEEEFKINPKQSKLVDRPSEVDPTETFTSDFYQVPL